MAKRSEHETAEQIKDSVKDAIGKLVGDVDVEGKAPRLEPKPAKRSRPKPRG